MTSEVSTLGAPLAQEQVQDDILFETLTIVVPAFNEEENIESTVQELHDAYRAAEIIVIDDGSTDDTANRVPRLDGVTVERHERNRGYGAALKTGIRKSSRSHVAWYDADGQHRPQDLRAVATPVLTLSTDASIGVRGRDSTQQRERVVGKFLLRWVAQLLSGQRIPDLNSGLRCFRRDVIRQYLHLLPDGFSASTTSTILLLKRGYRIAYVPIKTRPRGGASTVRIVADGLATLQLILRLVVLFEAFKVFTALGGGLAAMGLIYGIVIALVRGEGFPMLAGTVVIAGLLTFFMGIVADQITELRKERFEDFD